MKERELKVEELAVVVDKYIEALNHKLSQIKMQIDRFDWSRSISREEVQEKAEVHYLRANNLWNPKKDDIERKRLKYQKVIEKVEQGSQIGKIINYFRYNSAKRAIASLDKIKDNIEYVERLILKSEDAKRFIEQYTRKVFQRDPFFKEYQALKREKQEIEFKFAQLIKLREELDKSKSGKSIKYLGNINDDLDSFLTQIPIINSQLGENSVSIHEFEEAVKYHLKKIGKIGERDSEYQQIIEELLKVSKVLVEHAINDQEQKISEKVEQLSKIQYKDNGIINFDESLRLKLLQQEIISDKKNLLEFRKKALKAIDEAKWEDLPYELRLQIINSPEYSKLNEQLKQLNRKERVLKELLKLASQIPNKDQDIKINGFYLNRFDIVKNQESITIQLTELNKPKIKQLNFDK